MMSRATRSLLLPALLLVLPATSQAAQEALKKKAIASIDARRPELIELSDKVWEFAETALKETRSAALLADYAERQGFTVDRAVAGMPTAFVAVYGQGEPVIGILGEYDALPGLSQKAQPAKEARLVGAPGHGCGHNMFGAASLGAAIAVKELIESGAIKGTIKFFGTPAEEAVGGKVYMAREGLFQGIDVVVAWHPDTKTRADLTSGQALVDLSVEFKGKSAHAAFDPWNGRSAVDAMELFTHGINMLREHVRPSVRMHYVIQKGGDVPNVIPEEARLWLWVRDWERRGVESVLERVRDIAAGAGMMAGAEARITIQGGDYELLINQRGARLIHENLSWLGPIQYTDEEQQFARSLQTAAGVEPAGVDGSVHPLEGQEPEGGSTDVGDVSWLVPTLHMSVVTAPSNVPWHAWPVVASGGMSIGHKGMTHAAKAMASIMVELFQEAGVRQEIRSEFQDKTRGFLYKPFIPDGPPVLPGE
ncbi:MAG TPA: amidohydrolase [Candidatus Polarisedimenticolia bacterium]|nr:amidohydrolase [Candidatus Polarisedimenticolia bacterium]